MRILGELLLLALGIATVMVVSRGLQPVAPALAGVVRALLNPVVLALVVALLLLIRAGRSRRRRGKSAASPASEPDADEG